MNTAPLLKAFHDSMGQHIDTDGYAVRYRLSDLAEKTSISYVGVLDILNKAHLYIQKEHAKQPVTEAEKNWYYRNLNALNAAITAANQQLKPEIAIPLFYCSQIKTSELQAIFQRSFGDHLTRDAKLAETMKGLVLFDTLSREDLVQMLDNANAYICATLKEHPHGNKMWYEKTHKLLNTIIRAANVKLDHSDKIPAFASIQLSP